MATVNITIVTRRSVAISIKRRMCDIFYSVSGDCYSGDELIVGRTLFGLLRRIDNRELLDPSLRPGLSDHDDFFATESSRPSQNFNMAACW